jgi:hypothetical protein
LYHLVRHSKAKFGLFFNRSAFNLILTHERLDAGNIPANIANRMTVGKIFRDRLTAKFIQLFIQLQELFLAFIISQIADLRRLHSIPFLSESMPPCDQATFNRHLVSYAEQRKFGDLLIHPADFKHHRSGFDAGYPAFDFGFTLTHSGFERFGRIGMIGKYPDVHFAFAMQKVCGGYTTGFNLPAGNPAAFHSL